MFVCLFKFCGAIFFSQIKIEINKNYYFCCCRIHAFEKFNSISALTTFLTRTRFVKKSDFFLTSPIVQTQTQNVHKGKNEMGGKESDNQMNVRIEWTEHSQLFALYRAINIVCVENSIWISTETGMNKHWLFQLTNRSVFSPSLSHFDGLQAKQKQNKKMLFKKKPKSTQLHRCSSFLINIGFPNEV